MKYFLAALGLNLFALCLAGPATQQLRDEPPIDIGSLTIDWVHRKNDNSYDIQVTSDAAGSVKHYRLVKTVDEETGADESQVDAHDIVEDATSCTLTFLDDITKIPNKKIEFAITGLDDDDKPLIAGEAKWQTFPKVPGDITGQLATYTVEHDPSYILRIHSEDFGGMTTLNPGPTEGKRVTSDANIKYILNCNDLKKVRPCSEPKMGEIQVCDLDINLESTPLNIVTVKSATLRYEFRDSNKPIIELSNKDPKQDYPKNIDTIVSFDDKIKLIPTQLLEDPITIEVNGYRPKSEGTIRLRIVGLDGESTMTTYTELTIKDIYVIGYPVSETSIEVRWDYQIGYDTYKITRDGDGDGFHTATVA